MSDADSSSSSLEDKQNIEDDPKKKEECIKQLRALVTEEKNLKVRMDDGFMLRYLRATDFKPQEAFERMVKVYKFKLKNKECFCRGPLSKYRHLLAKNHVTLLEDRDQNGRRIYFVRLEVLDTDKDDFFELAQLNDVWMELALEEEESQKAGMVIIADMAGFPLRLLRYYLRKHTIISALKEEMRPWKNLDIHILNTSKFLTALVNLVFPVLSAKLKEHIHFHGEDWSSLHKFVDPKCLPKECSGQRPRIDYDKMRQYLYNNEEKLMELFSLEYKKS